MGDSDSKKNSAQFMTTRPPKVEAASYEGNMPGIGQVAATCAPRRTHRIGPRRGEKAKVHWIIWSDDL